MKKEQAVDLVNEQIQAILIQNGLEELPKTLREAALGGNRFLFPTFQTFGLRGTTVEEEDTISSRKKNKDGEGANILLKNCSNGETVLDWVTGDRTFAMMQIKILSHGPLYDFKCQCPYCDEQTLWQEDLGDLKVTYIKTPGKVDGFQVLLPDVGRKLTYRLLDGKDERRLNALFKDNDDSKQSAMMLFRTTEIEGEKIKAIPWFKKLTSMDATILREDVGDNDCGVDTTIVVECSHCFRKFDNELPMGIDFFLPQKTSRKR